MPFEFISEVLIEYFIDRSEYWCLDEEDQPSVSDWNDHVYHAESAETVRVKGILKISASMNIYDQLVVGGDDFDITNFDLSIDSIEGLETL